MYQHWRLTLDFAVFLFGSIFAGGRVESSADCFRAILRPFPFLLVPNDLPTVQPTDIKRSTSLLLRPVLHPVQCHQDGNSVYYSAGDRDPR
jgi:hypothetical protein